MKSLLPLFILLLLIRLDAAAQFHYTFSHATGAYMPLAGATSINGNTIWDEERYTMPLGFDFNLNGITVNQLFLWLSFDSSGKPLITTDTINRKICTGFIFSEADMIDRGAIPGSSRSPIRHLTSGTAPHRIFKAEIANAGFYKEFQRNNTLNDSVYMQMWLYESSNVIELRYGPSHITPGLRYFSFPNNGPLVGFVQNFNLRQDTGSIYYLSGNSTAPNIDSVSLSERLQLSGWPVNGTVYTFTPTGSFTGIETIASKGNLPIIIYPTISSGQLHIQSGSRKAARYEIRSVLGIEVQSGNLPYGASTIDISVVASGLYMLLVRNSDGTCAGTFFRQ